MPQYSRPAAGHAIPTTPYELCPPGPLKSDYIPIVDLQTSTDDRNLEPNHAFLESTALSKEDFGVLVGERGLIQTTVTMDNWTFGQRHQAQQILDFLYLGPLGAARRTSWLRDAAIDLIVVVRPESSVGLSWINLDSVQQETKVNVKYINLAYARNLGAQLTEIIVYINKTLVSNCRARKVLHDPSSSPSRHPAPRSNVLLVCETGNGTSAMLAVAYLMAVFGMSIERAVSFIMRRRFSCSMGEQRMMALRIWQDILHARSSVWQSAQDPELPHVHVGPSSPRTAKRKLGQILEDDPYAFRADWDQSRLGRGAFAPFIDHDLAGPGPGPGPGQTIFVDSEMGVD